MNVALVNRIFSLSHGGRERYAVNLASTLQNAGCQVTAVGQVLTDLPEGISTIRVDAVRHPRWWAPLSLQRSVHRSLAKNPFDLVYGLSPCPPLDIYRMGDGIHRHWLQARYPDALERWVFSFLRPVHLVNLVLEKRLFKSLNSPFLVANSRLCRDQLQNHYGVAAERIRVIYNGVDHRHFSPGAVAPLRQACRAELGLGDSDIAVLFVAHDWRRKGLDVLLEALARLGKKGDRFHLVVLGRGRTKRYGKLVNNCGLDHRVHLVGPVSSVNRYYGAGDLLALPTRYDPFANACLEAMACGLPVITTNANGAAELIVNGTNGYIQKKPDDGMELAWLLAGCLDPGSLAAMGRAAHRSAGPFTLEKNAMETLDLFKELMDQRGRHPLARTG